MSAVISKHITSMENGVFFGVELIDGLFAKHSYTQDVEDIVKYQGSKYIQSHTMNTFSQAKSFLERNYKVVYVGTPCQIAGLKLFLKKDYDNLYTIDVVCHGVASSKAYRKAIENCVENTGSILSVNFRSKKNGYINSSFEIQTKDRTMYFPSDLWDFGYPFASSLILRRSCYSCKFTDIDRVSDITLADYKDDSLNNYECKNGCSMVLLNTTKGKELFDECKCEFNVEQISVQKALEKSSRLRRSKTKNNKRENYFRHIDILPYDKLRKKYHIPPQNTFFIKCRDKSRLIIKQILNRGF